jgi:hypothetical protein
MQRRSDLPTYVAAVVALAATAGIIYAVVDAATVEATFDSNTPNATTGGPPASYEQP